MIKMTRVNTYKHIDRHTVAPEQKHSPSPPPPNEKFLPFCQCKLDVCPA